MALPPHCCDITLLSQLRVEIQKKKKKIVTCLVSQKVCLLDFRPVKNLIECWTFTTMNKKNKWRLYPLTKSDTLYLLSAPSLILPCFEGDPIIFDNILLPHVTWERDKEIERKVLQWGRFNYCWQKIISPFLHYLPLLQSIGLRPCAGKWGQ